MRCFSTSHIAQRCDCSSKWYYVFNGPISPLPKKHKETRHKLSTPHSTQQPSSTKRNKRWLKDANCGVQNIWHKHYIWQVFQPWVWQSRSWESTSSLYNWKVSDSKHCPNGEHIIGEGELPHSQSKLCLPKCWWCLQMTTRNVCPTNGVPFST